MAVTVEELQILLKCDATQAEATLGSLSAAVDKAVKKMENGGKSGKALSFYETTSKKLEKAMSQATKAYEEFESTGDSGAKANFGYYIEQSKKLTKQLEKARNAAGMAMGGGRNGAIGDAIANMGTLDKHVQKVSDHMRKMPNFNEFLRGEAPKEPTITDRATQKRVPYTPWAAVSKSDLESGEVGDMMKRARAFMADATNEASSKLQSVDTAKLTGGTEYEQLAEKLKVVENQAESLREKISMIGDGSENPQALMTLQTKLETAERKAEKLAKKLAELEDAANKGDSGGESPAAQNIEKTGDAAQNAEPKIEKYSKSVKKSASLSGLFGKASKLAHSAFSKFGKAAKSARSFFDGFGKSTKKHDGFLAKFGATLKRVIMRMMAMGLVRGVIRGITQGLQILTKANSKAAAELGKFKALGNSIKVALGSAALSVLNAFSGVLFRIASAAVTAANAVSQFFAIFGNGKYYATTMAESYDDLGTAIDGAGSAAKNSLAPFDELNVITKSGGGGGGGSQSGLGTTTVSEQQAHSPLAELLKSGEFESAGEFIAEKLDGITGKISAWFTNLGKKGYGTKFAKIINGIFKKPTLFESAGEAVANGFNTVVGIISDFLSTVEWKKVGSGFAAGVNKIIKGVSWSKLATTVSTGFNSVITAISEFVANIDWKTLSTSLSTGIKSAFNSINWEKLGTTLGKAASAIITTLYNLFASFDFVKAGKKLATCLNQIGANIDWDKVGGLIGKKIGGVFNTLYGFFSTFDFAKAGKNLGKTLNGIVTNINWENLGKMFSKAINGVFKTLYNFFSTFDFKKAAKNFASSINNMVKTIDWNNIGKTIITIIGQLIEFLLDFISNIDWFAIIKGLVDMIVGLIEKIVSNPRKLVAIIIKLNSTVVKVVTQLVGGLVAGIIKGLAKIFPGLEKTAEDVETWVKDFGDTLDNGAEFWDEWASSVEDAGDALDDAATSFSGYNKVLEDATKKTGDFGKTLKNIPTKKTTEWEISITTSGSTGTGTSATISKPTLNINFARMASGGIAYGDTLARIGEYAGARQNPEVVAPLNKLQAILDKSNGNNKDVARQNALLEEQNKLLRVIAQKEIKLGPSAELGQIVTKSQALFGAV